MGGIKESPSNPEFKGFDDAACMHDDGWTHACMHVGCLCPCMDRSLEPRSKPCVGFILLAAGDLQAEPASGRAAFSNSSYLVLRGSVRSYAISNRTAWAPLDPILST